MSEGSLVGECPIPFRRFPERCDRFICRFTPGVFVGLGRISCRAVVQLRSHALARGETSQTQGGFGHGVWGLYPLWMEPSSIVVCTLTNVAGKAQSNEVVVRSRTS